MNFFVLFVWGFHKSKKINGKTWKYRHPNPPVSQMKLIFLKIVITVPYGAGIFYGNNSFIGLPQNICRVIVTIFFLYFQSVPKIIVCMYLRTMYSILQETSRCPNMNVCKRLFEHPLPPIVNWCDWKKKIIIYEKYLWNIPKIINSSIFLLFTIRYGTVPHIIVLAERKLHDCTGYRFHNRIIL